MTGALAAMILRFRHYEASCLRAPSRDSFRRADTCMGGAGRDSWSEFVRNHLGLASLKSFVDHFVAGQRAWVIVPNGSIQLRANLLQKPLALGGASANEYTTYSLIIRLTRSPFVLVRRSPILWRHPRA
jgi:hypothetical protein